MMLPTLQGHGKYLILLAVRERERPQRARRRELEG